MIPEKKYCTGILLYNSLDLVPDKILSYEIYWCVDSKSDNDRVFRVKISVVFLDYIGNSIVIKIVDHNRS